MVADSDSLATARTFSGRMALVRVALGVAAFLTVLGDGHGTGLEIILAQAVLFAYVAYGACTYFLAYVNRFVRQSMVLCWLDVAWYALIEVSTGGRSYFFLFFVFTILGVAFRWGLEAGVRITLASAALYMGATMLAPVDATATQILIRVALILSLGCLTSCWGEAEIRQKRHLAMMCSVAQVSNPRFGVDHTLASVLEKLCVYFEAGSCVLVMRDEETLEWSLRTARRQSPAEARKGVRITAEVAMPLMALPEQAIVVYTAGSRQALPIGTAGGRCRSCRHGAAGWDSAYIAAAAHVAELLEAHSFISAPLTMRNRVGRVYLVSDKDPFSKAEALFLHDIAQEAFPVIENIALLDHLASGAALTERHKIARDVHDSAVQPYIGLTHGLAALRNKAAADNPLLDDIDKLLGMATQVISDLRQYAGSLAGGSLQAEPEFVLALRRQASHVKQFYGIEIAVTIASEFTINDRLAAEVIQLVSEGLSNIRRHTTSVNGYVHLEHVDGCLRIQIGNAHTRESAPAYPFVPRSISERAAALGGRAQVFQDLDGTAVHIEIPV